MSVVVCVGVHVCELVCICKYVCVCLTRHTGFPKKYAQPKLRVESDTLVGVLEYGGQQIAMGAQKADIRTHTDTHKTHTHTRADTHRRTHTLIRTHTPYIHHTHTPYTHTHVYTQ